MGEGKTRERTKDAGGRSRTRSTSHRPRSHRSLLSPPKQARSHPRADADSSTLMHAPPITFRGAPGATTINAPSGNPTAPGVFLPHPYRAVRRSFFTPRGIHFLILVAASPVLHCDVLHLDILDEWHVSRDQGPPSSDNATLATSAPPRAQIAITQPLRSERTSVTL